MKVHEVILYWEEFLRREGNVDLFQFEGDGHSTWTEEYAPKAKFTKEWPLKYRTWVVK